MQDLAVANGDFDGVVTVLLGNGDGTFHTAQTFAQTSYPTAVVVADLNQDGLDDLVITHYASVSVFIGTSGGTFRDAVTYPLAGGPICVRSSE